jgi:hypothetical protein
MARRVNSADIRRGTLWLAGLVETMDAVAAARTDLRCQDVDPGLRARVIAHLARPASESTLVPASPEELRRAHLFQDAGH